MDINGRIQNGVIVLDGGLTLPEGTPVVVSVPTLPTASSRPRKRLEFPVIPSANPGWMDLTAEQIARIMDEEDASS